MKNCKKVLKSQGINSSANPTKTVPKHAESVDHVLATANTTWSLIVVQCHTHTHSNRFRRCWSPPLVAKDLAASGAGLQCRSEVLFTNQRVQATGSPNRSDVIIYGPKARIYRI